MIGHDPIELLGHPPIEAPEAGLDVGDGDATLGGCKRPRERRVGVTEHEDRVGTLGRDDRIKGQQHPTGLDGVRVATDPKGVIRSREPELGKEGTREAFGPVLAGVDEHDLVT